MGWAKYLEDIASRHNGTSLVQNQLQKELGRVARPGSPKAPGKIKLKNQGEQHVSKLKDFVVTTARPLPVILLADVSGSMATNGGMKVIASRRARIGSRCPLPPEKFRETGCRYHPYTFLKDSSCNKEIQTCWITWMPLQQLLQSTLCWDPY